MIFKNNRLYIFQNKLIDYDRYINIQNIKKQLYKQQNALNRHQYQLNNQYKRQKNQQEELKQQIAYLTEIVENLSEKTIITEGSADTVDIIIGGHHFRGKMSPVKR